MDNIDLAKSLLNNSADTLKPNTSQSNLLPVNNSTQITATAQSDSVNGYVTVQIDGENIDIPTTFNVLAGDECLVLIANRSPVCIGIIGRGDTNNDNINNALSNAGEALENANNALNNAGEALENANNALNSVGRTNNILPYYLATGKGSYGIIVDKEEDGWFHIHGTTTTSSSTSGYAHSIWTQGDHVTLYSGKSYTFSIEVDGDFTFGSSTLRPQIRYYYDGTYSTAYAYPLQPATFQLAHDDTQTTAIRVALARATGVDLVDIDFRIRFKLEEGTLATPWNYTIPDISEASRVATNYMEFVENTGLIIGDHTSSSLGKNVCIDADSVDIRNGSSTLASFKSTGVEFYDSNGDLNLNFYSSDTTAGIQMDGRGRTFEIENVLGNVSIRAGMTGIQAHTVPAIQMYSGGDAEGGVVNINCDTLKINDVVHGSWVRIGTVSGSNTLNYTLTGYNEVMVLAYNGSTYLGTAIVPVAFLSSTRRELYLGGGYSGGTNGRSCQCNIYLTKIVGGGGIVSDSSTITVTYQVYAR